MKKTDIIPTQFIVEWKAQKAYDRKKEKKIADLELTPMWKKKWYDVTLRLTEEDIDTLHWASDALRNIIEEVHPFPIGKHLYMRRLNAMVWEIHNRCLKLQEKK